MSVVLLVTGACSERKSGKQQRLPERLAELSGKSEEAIMAALERDGSSAVWEQRVNAVRLLAMLEAEGKLEVDATARQLQAIVMREEEIGRRDELVIAIGGSGTARLHCAFLEGALAGLRADRVRATALSLAPAEPGVDGCEEIHAAMLAEWDRIGPAQLGANDGGAGVSNANKTLLRSTILLTATSAEREAVAARLRAWPASPWRDINLELVGQQEK